MIKEDLRLGIDLGTASCGWAMIRWDEDRQDGAILGMGSRMFDAPETDKDRVPTNQLRRIARGMRRMVRRRRQRMGEIRHLLAGAGLLADAGRNALKLAGLDPWVLRAEGLERRLSGPELAVALGHIAKHRGFKSNSKRDRGSNAADEISVMKVEIEKTQDRLEGRTIGEMFARDPRYARRKRNRDGSFDRSVLRDDQAAEVRSIFAAQHRLGNPFATAELGQSFATAAFSQRPLQDSEDRVGFCPFLPQERRAAKRAPSFERFRFLSRLATLRIGAGREERPLTAEEIAGAEAEFGKAKEFTWKALRKAIGLDPARAFAGVRSSDEKNDFVSRQGKAAEGTASLRKLVLGAAGEIAWMALLKAPERLDAIACIITFRDDVDAIRSGLEALDLEPAVLSALMGEVDDGGFAAFKGAGHISAAACRSLLAPLRAGRVYSDACRAIGFDHAERPSVSARGLHGREVWKALRAEVDDVANPIARKALGEALKQIKAIIDEYGLPGRMHIELARDVGKGKEERDEIARGIEKRTAARTALAALFRTDVGREPGPGSDDLLKYELLREQGHRCFYADSTMRDAAAGSLSIRQVFYEANAVQIDHVLPWSRSGDDSYHNKVLCLTHMNSRKGHRTPFEWLGHDDAQWSTFEAAVTANKSLHRRKRRFLLLKNADEVLSRFRARNLNDTRYACRLLLDLLATIYPADDTEADRDGQIRRRRRVFARPGRLTARLRRTWGIQGLKKDLRSDDRLRDDRHHALDALIVAATTESALQRLTRAFQNAERTGSHRDFADFPLPWPSFVADARRAHAEVFVSRAERRRARGEGHGATIRPIGEIDGKAVVYERKPVEKLVEADLARIKDPERNGEVVAELSRWIVAGKPPGAPPVKRFGGKTEAPYTEPIRKVSLRSGKKLDVLVRDGAAERGEMTRVDVFRKSGRRGSWDYFLVPIYPHQVFNRAKWPAPPNRAVSANMDESAWPEIGTDHEFCWSLYPLSLVELTKPNGDVILGYLRSMSRSTGAFSISPHQTLQEMRQGIGGRTLADFKKLAVDRLGRRFPIPRETRTWHGAACT